MKEYIYIYDSRKQRRNYRPFLYAACPDNSHCARHIEDGIGEGRARPAVGDLGRVLDVACEIAGEIHDTIEKAPALKGVVRLAFGLTGAYSRARAFLHGTPPTCTSPQS